MQSWVIFFIFDVSVNLFAFSVPSELWLWLAVSIANQINFAFGKTVNNLMRPIQHHWFVWSGKKAFENRWKALKLILFTLNVQRNRLLVRTRRYRGDLECFAFVLSRVIIPNILHKQTICKLLVSTVFSWNLIYFYSLPPRTAHVYLNGFKTLLESCFREETVVIYQTWL